MLQSSFQLFALKTIPNATDALYAFSPGPLRMESIQFAKLDGGVGAVKLYTVKRWKSLKLLLSASFRAQTIIL